MSTERWVCPRCGKEVQEFPALSRWDSKTKVCSQCGMEEAWTEWTNGRTYRMFAKSVHPEDGIQRWKHPERAVANLSTPEGGEG